MGELKMKWAQDSQLLWEQSCQVASMRSEIHFVYLKLNSIILF